MANKISMVWDPGGFECPGYWTWTVDNGMGLSTTGHASTARRAGKQAEKALDRLSRIQADPPRVVHNEQTEDK